MNTKRNTLLIFMSINSETLNCKHARMKKAVRSQREQKDVNCGSSVIHFVAHVPTSPSLVQAGNKKKYHCCFNFTNIVGSSHAGGTLHRSARSHKRRQRSDLYVVRWFSDAAQTSIDTWEKYLVLVYYTKLHFWNNKNDRGFATPKIRKNEKTRGDAIGRFPQQPTSCDVKNFATTCSELVAHR